MANFSGTQRLEKESGEAPVSMLVYIKKMSQALQSQELEEENEFLKTRILAQFMAAAEAPESVPDLEKVAQLRSPEEERELRERKEVIAELNLKANLLSNLYKECNFKLDEIMNRLKTLNHESSLRRFAKKMKSIIEKEKLIRKECDKLKKKEETYKTREKELNDKICKLEQDIKAKQAKKTAEILNEKYLNNLMKSKSDWTKRSFRFGDDDFSSLTSCYHESFQVQTQKTFKYCGKRSTYCTDKSLTYLHLKKTRTSITFTDSDSVKDKKRPKQMLQ